MAIKTDFTARPMTRLATSALLTGGLAAVALGFGAGTAQAGGPYTWCPGQSMTSGVDMEHHTGAPGGTIDWDMNVCHTWWYVSWGSGNINPGVWEGDAPAPDALVPRKCPPISFICA
jgi:hypothetical protein